MDTSTDTTQTIKKKRGRKKKSELENQQVQEAPVEPTLPKKRGRKPKGGKLIVKPIENNDDIHQTTNVILHLKCSLKDIHNDDNNSNNLNDPLSYKPIVPPSIMAYDNDTLFKSYNLIDEQKNNDIPAYENEQSNIIQTEFCSRCQSNMKNVELEDEDLQLSLKDINFKLKELKIQLYKDSNPDKKSACFWCTYDFDNPACYIPKYEVDGNTAGYGSFCRPECAAAYLLKENIDDSTKFERYQLLNRIYGKVYNYKKNIRPAPNPYYLLDKFYGNLTIQEYRKLLKSEHMLLVIEKPLTRILPELHEDTDDNNDRYNKNGTMGKSSGYKVKRQSEKQKGPSKNEIMRENFGF